MSRLTKERELEFWETLNNPNIFGFNKQSVAELLAEICASQKEYDNLKLKHETFCKLTTRYHKECNKVKNVINQIAQRSQLCLDNPDFVLSEYLCNLIKELE